MAKPSFGCVSGISIYLGLDALFNCLWVQLPRCPKKERDKMEEKTISEMGNSLSKMAKEMVKCRNRVQELMEK